jgi:hypothetical protein
MQNSSNSDRYLMIENRGVCPVQSFTLLGASSTRGDAKNSNPYLIGQFGSGSKHGIILCLRHKINPIVFLGNERLDFSERRQTINDGISTTEIGQVVCNGQDLGFVVEYGRLDWDKIEYALREFVSNAIDRTIRQAEYEYPGMPTATVQPWEHIVIKIVDNAEARPGFTRVFVPLTPAVWQFEKDLHKWFLHFREPKLLLEKILPKDDMNPRSLTGSKAACIYRRGVLVRQVDGERESLFDYNMNNLAVDESRKVNDSTVTFEAGRAISGVKANALQIVLSTFANMNSGLYWEHTFDTFTLMSGWEMEQQIATKKDEWQKAFQLAFGVDTTISTNIFCHNPRDANELSRRGFRPIMVSTAWYEVLKRYGLRTAHEVLTADQRDGRHIFDEPLPAHTAAVKYVWDKFVSLGLTNEKVFPSVHSFQEIMKAGGTQVFGFHRDGGIYLHVEIESTGLLKCVSEELAHYITEANDETRDLQDFAFRVIGHLI